jgi:hypothetical protein
MPISFFELFPFTFLFLLALLSLINPEVIYKLNVRYLHFLNKHFKNTNLEKLNNYNINDMEKNKNFSLKVIRFMGVMFLIVLFIAISGTN